MSKSSLPKLLFVISSLEGSGGSERALTTRINYLVSHFSYEITVVTTNKGDSCKSFYPLEKEIKILNIPINFSTQTLKEKFKYFFFQSFENEKQLSEFIEKEKFDICTSFGAETFLFDKISYKDFIKIKEHRFTYKKYLTSEKISLIKKFWRNFRFKKYLSIQSKMDYIITLTEEDANFWRKYVKNVHVIPNAIDLGNIQTSGLESNTIISVGRLEKEKDYFSLINIFKKVVEVSPDWELHIYGNGSLKQQIEQKIQMNKLEKNVFLKGVTKDIFSKYLESSVFVMTSFYEGFPNTMLEAMAHGLPAISFASVGGVKVLIDDEKNGFLVPNRDSHLFFKAIKILIKDDTKRKEMGTNARKKAEEFEINSIIPQWHQFYSKIIVGK